MARIYTDTWQYLEGLEKISMVAINYGQAQAVTGATLAVALTWIKAADIVLSQVTSWATVAYISKIVITAGTGFVVSFNTSPGTATFDYTVFRLVASLY